MGAGAKSEAIRLISAAIEVIEGIASGEEPDDEITTRIDRVLDHGVSRRVDHRLRQHKADNNVWADFDVAQIESALAARPGLAVVLGSHPNGYVREEAVRLAAKTVDAAAEADSDVKVLPGLAQMLSQRALDPVPTVQARAIDAVAALMATEASSDNTGRLPTAVERACRELVGTTKCIGAYPQLVGQALDLFALRVGRYSNNGIRDHHRHNLKEVDRRTQLLTELEHLRPALTDETAQHAADRLIEFYQASMRPTSAVS